jgi:DMSO/TMAO reductase YedYZ heme-binding membrane subunit
MMRLLLILFSVMYGYAAIRYHLGKNVPWTDWLFILNKAFAWLAFTMVAMTIIKDDVLKKYFNVSRKKLGIGGFLLALIHILITIIIFSSAYYPKFYHGEAISLNGWLFIGIGATSALVYSLPFVASLKRLPNENRIFRLGKYGVYINAFHPLLIGIEGWLTPQSWPLFMPPITLLSLVGLLIAMVIRRTS